jgi:signal transduction histidine kinase
MLRVNEAYSTLIALDKAPHHTLATPAERAAMLAVRDEHGHLLSQEQQPVQRMLAGEVFTANRAIDIQVHTLDGRELQLNITGTPMYDQEHTLTGGVLIFRDVTERRALERRTQEALEALLTMAEDLVHLPEQAEQDTATKISNGVSRPLAELIRRVLGCERVAVTAIDQVTHELHSLAVVGITPEQEQLWYARESGFHLSGLLSDTPSFRLQDLDGPVIVDFTQPPLCNQPNPFGIQTMILTPMKIGSRLIGILVLDYGKSTHVYTRAELNLTKVVADLSALVIERERLQREQAAAQASVLALNETNRMMDEFIGIAGHELRTPLTTVKASVQLANRQLARLLSQQDALSPTIEKQLATVKGHLDRTERQVGMQNRLIRDLLDVSRIHADRLELHPELCDLVSLVREVVEDQHYLTPQRTLELSINTPDEILVLVDADRIRQVISNYLSNALKYSEASKPVQVHVDLLDTQVRVSVQDEGPGLTLEQQQRIWERFYRAPGIEVRTGSGVGLGLGLHISRTIIERHDGHLGVHSNPPHGSTFWFTLPLAEQKPLE